jgi:hypothetical protein
MYIELENAVHYASSDDETIEILKLNTFKEVPTENYVFINPEDI